MQNNRNDRAIARATERKAVKSFWAKGEEVEAKNIEIARIFIRDPERYEGISFEWAYLVLSKRGLL